MSNKVSSPDRGIQSAAPDRSDAARTEIAYQDRIRERTRRDFDQQRSKDGAAA
jgi:hypothetical protein